jgi:cytochrome oxidase Cu insertion factor (SCO1/SenC/PrrC family)
MNTRDVCSVGMLVLLMQGAWLTPIPSQGAQRDGPAPAFILTTQDGKRLSLKDLGGKVVAITFIYTSCADTCPLLTAKMAGLQAGLGSNFGSKVFFISITVDPQHDTPAVLKRYAGAHGANTAGLGVSYGIVGRDPAGGEALRDLLQKEARWRCGPYLPDIRC